MKAKQLSLSGFTRRWEEMTGRPLNDEQQRVVIAGPGPVWVPAGPGSGKSETLAARVLRLLLVADGTSAPPDPASLMITTFTTKAAENLKTRLTDRLTSLGCAQQIDLSMIWVGTLHSLCDKIMRDYRYPPYHGLNLMDEVEQAMFISRHTAIVKEADVDFWSYWRSALSRRAQGSVGKGWAPAKWDKTKAAITLFNRMAEDNLNEQALYNAKEAHVRQLYNHWMQYREKLQEYRRCDFGLVQRYFLDFLGSAHGQLFLKGDPNRQRPALRFLLVDEYQDTNPVQEAIYFRMASDIPGNCLTVVGDDDQALYRFRGGTVESLVEFGNRCQAAFNVTVKPIQLRHNYRSHSKIVEFFNRYIERPEIASGRAPGKQRMAASSKVSGGVGVATLTAATVDATARALADTIQALMAENRIEDWSDVAVLFRSTQERPRAAGPYVAALRDRGIPVYNPRSKKLLQAEEVCVALGALTELVDPERRTVEGMKNLRAEVVALATGWHQAFLSLARNSPLRKWVETAARVPKVTKAGKPLQRTLREEFYHILSLPPFAPSSGSAGWLEDPERNFRIARLTQLLENHARALGKRFDNPNGVGFLDGDYLGIDKDNPTRLSPSWVEHNFYRGLVEYLESFGANDPEDSDVEIVSGRVQIMTVHQSKGLEFPYVFVVSMGEAPNPNDGGIVLEERLCRYRLRSMALADAQDRASQDVIRYYYVAYSRAIRGLILVDRKDSARQGQFWFPVS